MDRKAEILNLIRDLAGGAGTPPGRSRFEAETGIKPHEWRGKIWRTWGDALTEAGFEAREWTTQIPENELLDPVVALAEQLQRFPNSGDLLFESGQNPQFPVGKTILQRWTMRSLAEAVQSRSIELGKPVISKFCLEYLASLKATPSRGGGAPDTQPVGYVYMVRYGRDYKIGRTSSLSRRSRQIQIELPETTEVIHQIRTDDPVGVEAYWHKRFAEYRGNGEWFRLPDAAVRSFKRWIKIS